MLCVYRLVRGQTRTDTHVYHLQLALFSRGHVSVYLVLMPLRNPCLFRPTGSASEKRKGKGINGK